MDSQERPAVVKIYLRVSKCDKAGRGVAVFLGRVETPVCPVAALLSFMVVRVQGLVHSLLWKMALHSPFWLLLETCCQRPS